ncbi:MAG: hypothetical protein KatS3mg089_0619 [Patescibacteria group bacterium]|jgi:hypothetical protein|nr:MAG: hypothetical protein KatS3mg089_0619 [Patescibacteria group bacterium]
MARNQPYEKSSLTLREIIVNNFVGGIAWGLGVTVGLAILFTILGFFLHQLNIVPFLGNFINDIVKYVMKNNPYLR